MAAMGKRSFGLRLVGFANENADRDASAQTADNGRRYKGEANRNALRAV